MLRLFISLYLLSFLLIFQGSNVAEKLAIYIFEDDLKEDLQKDYYSLQILLEALQKKIDGQSFKDLLQHISENTNLPAEARTIDEWDIDEGRQQLQQIGDIYVSDYPNDILYMRLDHNQVVKVGPMQTTPTVQTISIYFQLIPYILTGITILIWVSWQQYKIHKLSLATRQLSQGKLSTRVPTGLLSVPGLSKPFNIMAERIQRLFSSHKHLTNAVSHELRSPITRIRFQLELFDRYLEKLQLTPQDQHHHASFLKGLSENLDGMDKLVDEMLGYAKMERSELLTTPKKIDITAWLIQQRENLLTEISKALTIISPDSVLHAVFDDELMARLLRNLVANADRYATSRIVIELTHTDDQVTLSVSDDGIGIPQDKRQAVLEPFFRVDPSRTHSTGGHGLGLAIVAQIVRCHHGEIDIQSSPLGGAKIIIRWPLHAFDAS